MSESVARWRGWKIRKGGASSLVFGFDGLMSSVEDAQSIHPVPGFVEVIRIQAWPLDDRLEKGAVILTFSPLYCSEQQVGLFPDYEIPPDWLPPARPVCGEVE